VSVRRRLSSLSLLTTAALVLTGCALFGGTDGEVEEDSVASEATETETDAGETPESTTSGEIAVPTCDTIYSQALTTALLGEVRVNIGETSEGDFGYGTTNRDLVSVLKNVRRDLRISCTWYLPASESVSVTSVAIVSADIETDVNRVLAASGATREDLAGGVLWTLDSTSSNESPDFIATEAHFVTPVPCPSSLADTACALWVSSNYAFGSARTLTLDAATQLEVLQP
jgi:hypothetical protein